MNRQTENRTTPSDEDSLRAIARQAGVTEDVVRARHLAERLYLENGATIRDFIPLLALKHVREAFRHPAKDPAPRPPPAGPVPEAQSPRPAFMPTVQAMPE